MHVFAQQDVPNAGAEIAGSILYKPGNEPAAFATVVLRLLPDSSIVATTATTDNGRFIFEKLSKGQYLLHYTSGDETQYLAVAINAQQTKYDVGKLYLGNKATELQTAVVNGKKSLVNAAIDRKVYVVDKDIMGQSGSASDILKNVPSVDVDMDGQVSLRGSSEVLVLVNGKVSPMMGRTRAEVLQQLPANSIERIEVITNPSAKHRPDGTAGIINIVLKKNAKQGVNGSVTANAGSTGRYNASAMINYHPGKVNFSANYGYRKDYRYRYSNVDRIYYDTLGKVSTLYNERNVSRAMPASHMAGAGTEWQVNSKTTLGASINYFYQSFERNDFSERYSYDTAHVLTNAYNRLRYDPENEDQVNAVASFHREFGDDHELNIEWNTSKANEKENNHYTMLTVFLCCTTSATTCSFL